MPIRTQITFKKPRVVHQGRYALTKGLVVMTTFEIHQATSALRNWLPSRFQNRPIWARFGLLTLSTT
jgi:hypothetical protein